MTKSEWGPLDDFQQQYRNLMEGLWYQGEKVPATQWQSQDITSRPGMEYSRELQNVRVIYRVPGSQPALEQALRPSVPWAEDHFLERVSGEPLNPPPSEQWWPYAVRGNEEHKTPFDHLARFSHTYPERIWPKMAGEPGYREIDGPLSGIRYRYGDLNDVVQLLKKDILTRQAYLPIWFPEDTGAVEGQRVPCTLGYHFLFRPGYFSGSYVGQVVYYLRSCDLIRHFTDDAYMAARLLQWIVEKLRVNGIDARPHLLVMYISSLHTFAGDDYRISQELGVKMRPPHEDEEDEVYGSAV